MGFSIIGPLGGEGDVKLQYDQETDSLYIHLAARPSVDSREMQDGVVVDLDSVGHIVGIDTVETSSLPPSKKT